MSKSNIKNKLCNISIISLSFITLFILCNVFVNNGLRAQTYLNIEPQYEYNFLLDEFYKEDLYSVVRECSYFLDTLNKEQIAGLTKTWKTKHTFDPSSSRTTAGYAVLLFISKDHETVKKVLGNYVKRYGDDGYILPLYLFYMNEKEGFIPKYSQPQKIRTVYQRFIHGYMAYKNGDTLTALIDLVKIFIRNPLFILLFGVPLILLLGIILFTLLAVRYSLIAKLRSSLSSLKTSSVPATTLLNNILIIILLLTLSMICYFLLSLLQKSDPSSTTVFSLPNIRYSDLIIHWYYGKALLSGINPYFAADTIYFDYSKVILNYLPGSLIFSSLFSLMPKDLAITTLAFITISFLLILMCFILRKIRFAMPLSLIFAAIAAIEYPVKFSLDRANIELISFIFISVFFYFLGRKKELLSIISLSIAATIKPFPIFLIPLIWSRFGFRSLIRTSAILLLFLFVTLIFIPGNCISAFNGVIHSLVKFNNIYGMDTRNSIDFNHSLYILIIYFMPNIANCTAYSLLAGVIVASLYFVRVRRFSLINQSIYLLVAMILLPPVSFDYYLLYMHLVLLALLLIAFIRSTERSTLPTSYYLLLVILITMITIKPGYLAGGVLFGPIVNSFLLLSTLLIVSLVELDKNNEYLSQLLKYFSAGKKRA